MNWTLSTSNYERQLEPYFKNFDPLFQSFRTKFKEILQEEADLNEIVQLVGSDSLSEDQKLTLDIAKIIREDFLQQDAFSKYDYMCPLYKTVGMMKAISTYYDEAKKAISESSNRDIKLNWVTIQNQTKPLYMRLTRFKFESPKKSQ